MANRKAVAAGGALALAIGLITAFEGSRTKTYLDPIGIPTVCVGHTGPDVQMGQTHTQAECRALLEADMGAAWDAVASCVANAESLPPWTRAAYASFAFNVGSGTFCKSSVAKLASAGKIPDSCNALLWYNKANGQQLQGLIRRREAERHLCLGEAF